MRDLARDVHVLLDERGRGRERGSDVREPLDLDLGRQVLDGIDLDAEQILDGVGVLVAAQALRGDVAHGPGCAFVDRALEPRDEPVDFVLIRLPLAGRRHLPATELPYDLLEDLGVLGHGLGGKLLEAQLAGAINGVVAVDAIGLEHCKALLLACVLESAPRQRAADRDDGDARRREP